MARHPDVDFEVNWHPFFLNRNLPQEGADRKMVYDMKFGPERAAALVQRLAGVFASEGLPYAFGGRVGNTMDSHRLTEFAKTQGKASDLQEQLFKAYMSEEKCLSDRDVLLEAAERAGLEGAAAVVDDPDRHRDDVEKDIARFARGISGVPHFSVRSDKSARPIQVSGAQPEDFFDDLFDDLK